MVLLKHICICITEENPKWNYYVSYSKRNAATQRWTIIRGSLPGLPRWEMTLNVKHLDPRIITMCSENYQMCSSSDGRERLFPTCKRPAFRFRKLIPCSSPSFVKLPFPPHPGNYFRCTWKKDRKQCIMETLIAWGKWQEKKNKWKKAYNMTRFSSSLPPSC